MDALMTTSYEAIENLQITGNFQAPFAEILSEEAQRFLLALHRQFDGQRRALLKAREARQAEINQGRLPHFLPDTQHIREGDWKVAPLPPDLLDRRVEITGPVERKMVINALKLGREVLYGRF
jgi:malate synthase